jgi:hypothetical protein
MRRGKPKGNLLRSRQVSGTVKQGSGARLEGNRTSQSGRKQRVMIKQQGECSTRSEATGDSDGRRRHSASGAPIQHQGVGRVVQQTFT